MERYNYLEAVKDDVREYVKCNDIRITASTRDEIEAELNDDLFCEDSVTGNASGSYTFNTWKAEEYICHNLDLLAEVLREFGTSGDVLTNGAEACDVTIRCYLLGQAIAEVLDEIEEEDEEEEDEEE